jgi:alpha-methylacyl-CoA racemase
VLQGVRIVEFGGLGPAPFAMMLLADLGAEVVTVRRPGLVNTAMTRNRPAVELDLRDEVDRALAQGLVKAADVVVEAFRPGVMERLGLGPNEVAELNPRVVYARMTGWGQTGPRAQTAGHDLTYIAVTGALHLATRRQGVPVPPANLLGDFGGGGMLLCLTIASALIERSRTGRGRVLDVAIVDGTNYLTSMLHEYRAAGSWVDTPASNRLDTGAPYYDVYPCADGRFVAIGALEDPFFADLVELLGIEDEINYNRLEPQHWPRLRATIATAVARRSRDEWAHLAFHRDACLAPVLNLAEASAEYQLQERGVLVERDDRRGWTPRLPWGFVPESPPLEAVLSGWALEEGVRTSLFDRGAA